MEMTPKDVLNNLKNFNSWDFKGYTLNKAEADECIKALDDRSRFVAIQEIVKDHSIWEKISEDGNGKMDYKGAFEAIGEIVG